MKYTPNPLAGAKLLEDVRSAQDEAIVRKEGLHMTDLVFCRRKAWYRLNGYPSGPHTTTNNLQLLLGTALGALLQSLTPSSEVPVTLELPNATLHSTVDMLYLDQFGQPTLVVELKESRSSSKKSLNDMGYYVEQIGTYCLATGLTHARLHVAHLLGDYSGPKLPVFQTWDCEFSEPELLGWYHELDLRARGVMAHDPPSSIMQHWSFECQGCDYAATCPAGPGYTAGFFTAVEA